VLGPWLIAPFRQHHRDPEAVTRGSFLRRNVTNFVGACLPLAAVLALLEPGATGPAAAAARSAVLAFALAIALTNQVHCWAHARRVPRLVRRLQRAGLVLRPEHHARHHREGGAFCVTGGWLDGPLERAGLFSALEHGLARRRRRVARGGRSA